MWEIFFLDSLLLMCSDTPKTPVGWDAVKQPTAGLTSRQSTVMGDSAASINGSTMQTSVGDGRVAASGTASRQPSLQVCDICTYLSVST